MEKNKTKLIILIEDIDEDTAKFLVKYLLKKNMVIKDKDGTLVWVYAHGKKQKELLKGFTKL
ncbi:MAG: hypothetical protein R3321_02370 [Nitrososphaeraceae archaeon]|nr:hypothetical protein [Nitrososphaeraceae archaeon]